MIEGKWKGIYAADKIYRQIGTKVDDGYSFSKASLYGTKHHNHDRNFDGFIDNRIFSPFTGERQTEYFTSGGIVSRASRDAPLLNQAGDIVEIEWTESGYEIIEDS